MTGMIGAKLNARRVLSTGGALLALLVLAIVFAPTGRLSCHDPYLTEKSPDGRWTITVCGRPMMFAMPGSGSDAPSWIVLRDDTGAIRGVSSLAMLQLYGGAFSGGETEWSEARVQRPMVFALPLHRSDSAFGRWWDERIWRLRALVGFVPDERQYEADLARGDVT